MEPARGESSNRRTAWRSFQSTVHSLPFSNVSLDFPLASQRDVSFGGLCAHCKGYRSRGKWFLDYRSLLPHLVASVSRLFFTDLIAFFSFRFFIYLVEGNPIPFAVNYTVGHLLQLLASIFLCGPKRQFK
jgi:hypothetical protein